MNNNTRIAELIFILAGWALAVSLAAIVITIVL